MNLRKLTFVVSLKLKTAFAWIIIVASGLADGAMVRTYAPTPYRSALDSPFYEGIEAGTIYLEDFEDGLLNTPFVTDPLPGPFTRGTTYRAIAPGIPAGVVASVDRDDGLLDFQGDAGDSWITFQLTAGLRSSFDFEFQPNEHGQYPVYVGIVVTEVADIDENVDFGIYGETDRNLATRGEFDPGPWFDPGELLNGDVETHRFIGFYVDEGVRRFFAENTLQVDHLQYGYALPEPSTAVLILSGVGMVVRRSRKRRSR